MYESSEIMHKMNTSVWLSCVKYINLRLLLCKSRSYNSKILRLMGNICYFNNLKFAEKSCKLKTYKIDIYVQMQGQSIYLIRVMFLIMVWLSIPKNALRSPVCMTAQWVSCFWTFFTGDFIRDICYCPLGILG